MRAEAPSPKGGGGETDSGDVPSPVEITVYHGCKGTPLSATTTTYAFARHCQGARSRADVLTDQRLA